MSESGQMGDNQEVKKELLYPPSHQLPDAFKDTTPQDQVMNHQATPDLNNPDSINNDLTHQLQQELYLNLYRSLEQEFYHRPLDMLIKSRTESQNMVPVPPSFKDPTPQDQVMNLQATTDLNDPNFINNDPTYQHQQELNMKVYCSLEQRFFHRPLDKLIKSRSESQNMVSPSSTSEGKGKEAVVDQLDYTEVKHLFKVIRKNVD